MRWITAAFLVSAALMLGGVSVPEAEAGGCGYTSYASYGYLPSSYYPTYYYPPAQYYYRPKYVIEIDVPMYSIGGTGQKTVGTQVATTTTTVTTTATASGGATVNGTGPAGGGVSATSTSPCTAELAAIKAEMAQLKAMIAASGLQRPAGQEKLPPPKEEPNGFKAAKVGVFSAKCAACHTQETADEFGGGKVLVEGPAGKEVLKAGLDAKMLMKVQSKSYGGQMPPKDNKKQIAALTDTEVGEIMAAVEKASK